MQKQTRQIATWALVALSTAALATAADSNRHKEEFRHTFTLVNGRIDLTGFNGSVEIIGWDNNSVEVTGIKYASELSDLSRVQVEAVQEGSTVRIRATKPKEGSGWRCNCGAQFTIHTPRRTELTSIRTSNGSIRVENIDGASTIGTSNGGIKLINLRGRIEAKTSNGGVTLQSIEGGATVTTSNGGVTVDDVRGSLRVTTSNGSIRGRLVDTTNSEPISLSTSNGGIDLRVDALRSNDITATTSNGSVTLRMPVSANARISAVTSTHESVTTDFSINVPAGTLSKNRLEGAIGNGGGPLIRVETSNGPIRLLRL
jgi:DUF4097 and DUF4098 domain-containing protein YvlB